MFLYGGGWSLTASGQHQLSLYSREHLGPPAKLPDKKDTQD